MLSRREFGKGPGEADRTWLSWRQFMAVVVFVALVAALVVWTTVAVPGPIGDIKVEVLVPALASSAAADSRPANQEEAP